MPTESKTSLRDAVGLSRLEGYWATFPSAQVHEMFALAGFDFGIVDLEHGTFSFQEALETVQILQARGLFALIRPSSHDPKEILRCLELGVDGIMIPDVSSAAQAEQLVSNCLYPPLGRRGASGFTRATEYGSRGFQSHTERANSGIFISLLVESKNGLSNAQEIAAVDHVDNIYFGTYDIASSMALGGQSSEIMASTISDCIDSIERPGLSFGQVAVDEEQYGMLDARISLVPLGVDCGIALRGFQAARDHG